MMIGALSRIPYRTFRNAGSGGGVRAGGDVIALWLTFQEFDGRFIQVPPDRAPPEQVLLWKALVVSAGMVASSFGTPVAETAIVAGALLLVTRRVKPGRFIATSTGCWQCSLAC
jgi:hypothetical protein